MKRLIFKTHGSCKSNWEVKLSKGEVGKRYNTSSGGVCEIVRYINAKDVEVQFLDEHRHRVKTEMGNIRRGNVRNPFTKSVFGVGFLGSGVFTSKTGGKQTLEYIVWNSMMARCYGRLFQESNPTYVGCSVHPDWHNFQNFADWYVNQEFYGLGYELDKDLLCKGNKVYSAETCCLVPRQLNTLLNTKKRGKNGLPVGVHKEVGSGRFRASYAKYGKAKYLGVFLTAGEARKEYLIAKREHIKSVVSDWEGLVDKRVLKKILEWEENE